jgi:hypothetical protein
MFDVDQSPVTRRCKIRSPVDRSPVNQSPVDRRSVVQRCTVNPTNIANAPAQLSSRGCRRRPCKRPEPSTSGRRRPDPSSWAGPGDDFMKKFTTTAFCFLST